MTYRFIFFFFDAFERAVERQGGGIENRKRSILARHWGKSRRRRRRNNEIGSVVGRRRAVVKASVPPGCARPLRVSLCAKVLAGREALRPLTMGSGTLPVLSLDIYFREPLSA